MGGAREKEEHLSRSPKKKAAVTDIDGVTRATTSNNAAGAASGGGGTSKTKSGGGKSGKRTSFQMGDIEGEPRFTGREMRLTAAVAILTILLFGLASFVVVSGPLTALLNPRCLDERLGYAGLCDSVECIDISFRSVHSANFSADPCKDFYQFACAKWQLKNPIVEEQLIFAANINQIKDNVDGFLRTLLEEETPSHKLDPGVTALKNFYKSCINFTNPNENELILDLLDSLGGYKTTDLWSDNDFDLTEVILKFLQVNAAPLFDLTLDIDAKNRERYALIVELPRVTSLVPNLFRSPSQKEDLMHSEYAYYYNLVERNEPISLEVTPGLINATTLSKATSRASAKNTSSSNDSGGDDGARATSNGARPDSSNNGSPPGANTVERHALYKIIKDSIDAKKREDLKALVRKVGQLIRMSEAEILSDSQDVAVIASNIEKIKPSQRSRKFWKQQNKEYNAYTLSQLQHQFGTVQWSFLFGELMGFDDVASREVADDYYYNSRVSSGSGGSNGNSSNQNGSRSNAEPINWHNSTIYVPYPDYLRRVLQMTQYTSKRMLYNTMLILYVKDMLQDLMPKSYSGSLSNPRKEEPKQQQHHHPHQQQHKQRIRGQQQQPKQQPQQQQRKNHQHYHQHQRQQRQHPYLHMQQPRWKFCVQSTKSVFAMELSSLYMKSFKPSTLKRMAHQVNEIFANVKETLITFLNRSSELSPQSDGAEEERHKHGDPNNNFHNNNHSNTSHNHQVPLHQGNKNSGSGSSDNTSGAIPSVISAGESGRGNGGNGSNSHNSNHNSIGSNVSGSSGRLRNFGNLGANAEPHVHMDGGNSFSDNGRSSFKDEAIKKITMLKGNFLGPSFYLQEDFLDDAIKNIRIDPNDFLFNVKVVYRTFREQLYQLYWKPVNEERATWAFVTFPTTVNAFYIPQFNSIVIPLAFLNPPNYMEGAPVYINYATIAHTIAHEALHSLDRSGSGFDANGRLQDSMDSVKGFLQEKANCVSKQYSESFRKILPFYQTHVPIQVDGNLTQNENLADIAGLQVAFSAYRKYRFAASKEDLKSERRIPGLVLTLEQAYFLTFAQAYCSNTSPMGYIFFLEMEEHTPHPERINGMLMNTPEFADAFSCRRGAPMNPPLKCSVW